MHWNVDNFNYFIFSSELTEYTRCTITRGLNNHEGATYAFVKTSHVDYVDIRQFISDFFFLNFSLRWQLRAHKEDSFGSPSCHIEYVTSNGTASACALVRDVDCPTRSKPECVMPVILLSHLARQQFRRKLDSNWDDWLCTICSLDLFLKLNLSSGFDPSFSGSAIGRLQSLLDVGSLNAYFPLTFASVTLQLYAYRRPGAIRGYF